MGDPGVTCATWLASIHSNCAVAETYPHPFTTGGTWVMAARAIGAPGDSKSGGQETHTDVSAQPMHDVNRFRNTQRYCASLVFFRWVLAGWIRRLGALAFLEFESLSLPLAL